jgi:hypothetical protein
MVSSMSDMHIEQDDIGAAVDECPVCMTQVQLSSLDGCCHKLCMKCATEIATNHAVCPLCRIHFTTVIEPGKYELTYHISGKFKIRGFTWVSAFCMGLANKLIFANEEDEEYVVYMPEFLNDLLAARAKLYWLDEAGEFDNIQNMVTDEHRLQRFNEMEEAVKAWRNLPIIYTRLVMARHLERMINEKIFKRYKLYADAESRALRKSRRHKTRDADPSEEEGGHHYTLICLPIDSF